MESFVTYGTFVLLFARMRQLVVLIVPCEEERYSINQVIRWCNKKMRSYLSDGILCHKTHKPKVSDLSEFECEY